MVGGWWHYGKKELDRYNISLWDSQIYQMEMLQRSVRSSIIEAESPMADCLRQNEAWAKQMCLQLQPMLGSSGQIRSITQSLHK